MTFRNIIRSNRYRLPIATSYLVVALAGCSSAPKPVAQIASAETSFNAAESKDAEQYAPVPMDRARQKLAKAKKAVEQENFQQARRLAEEAQADAELAQAIADQTQTQAAVMELEAGIEALRNEIERAARR